MKSKVLNDAGAEFNYRWGRRAQAESVNTSSAISIVAGPLYTRHGPRYNYGGLVWLWATSGTAQQLGVLANRAIAIASMFVAAPPQPAAPRY